MIMGKIRSKRRNRCDEKSDSRRVTPAEVPQLAEVRKKDQYTEFTPCIEQHMYLLMDIQYMYMYIRKYGSTFYIGIAMVILPYFDPMVLV